MVCDLALALKEYGNILNFVSMRLMVALPLTVFSNFQIKKMDLEARSLPPNVKSSLLVKLREYKSDLNNFKSEVKRITSGNLNASARDELLEAGRADLMTVCRDLFNTILIVLFETYFDFSDCVIIGFS